MKRNQPILGAIFTGILVLLPALATAQTLEREGQLQLDMVNVMLADSALILSNGTLAELETDPNFTGNWEEFDEAAISLLDNHTIVSRGGNFPENQGIPLNQQLTLDECVYQLFQLDNGKELMIYQSPQNENVQYLIRGVN
ncbi:MAG: hypothetical protein AAGD25_36135 [Cyanobacteria bacterium P01_F01_bin.150]